MAKQTGLTDKERQAVNEYFSNGFNWTQAMISAGYSEATAKKSGSRIKKKKEVQEYIAQKQEELDMLNIMSQKEVLEYTTKIAKREQQDYMVLQNGQVVAYTISTNDQLKALGAMAKYHGMDKVEVNHSMRVETYIYGQEDDDILDEFGIDDDDDYFEV
ncbi:MAG: terminase small subunit [Clostridium sp.]|nr:terminase small subunit [Clostridium sp.]